MDSSAAKISANRANALLSSGPRTPVGKASSSKNALRHGLLAKEVLMPGESRKALADLRSQLIEELQPEGALEASLVDRVVAVLWRLRRLGKIEAGLLSGAAAFEYEEPERTGFAFIRMRNDENLQKLSRYEAMLDRAMYRALHELERRQAARRGQPVLPPVAVDVDVVVNRMAPPL